MGNEKYYLKLNVAIEALIDRWYAWAHLVSPATAAMNIKDRHIKIMKSYVKNPKIHEAAVNRPEMRGGPFIDYQGQRVDEIEQLLERTIAKRANMLQFNEAVHELNGVLQKEAVGYSLNPLYDKIPEVLKGYVELYYDLNDQPNFRFFEALLYKSEYYDESTQSILLQLIEADDDRSFVLSTPRLDGEALLHLDVKFKDHVIDKLFEMKRTPGDYDEIKEALQIRPEQEELFKSFFTREPPKKIRTLYRNRDQNPVFWSCLCACGNE